MSDIHLSVESLDAFEATTRDMARRLDDGDRRASSGHFAFESMEALLQVLTANRWRLIRILRRTGPGSIRSLAQAAGRDYRAVHADVTALLQSGLIERDDAGRIFVPWSRLTAGFDLDTAA